MIKDTINKLLLRQDLHCTYRGGCGFTTKDFNVIGEHLANHRDQEMRQVYKDFLKAKKLLEME